MNSIKFTESDETMEDLLFRNSLEDDRTVDFLNNLISASSLKSAWGELNRRVRDTEKKVKEILKSLNREVLETDFVLRREYVAKVEEEHTAKLQEHGERVERLEHLAQQQGILGKEHSRLLEEHQLSLAEKGSSIADILTNVDRIEKQDQERHEAVLRLHADTEAARKKQDVRVQDQHQEVVAGLAKEEAVRTTLSKEVEKQKDFLAGHNLQVHIENICKEILKLYVPRADMLVEARQAAGDLVNEVHVEVVKLTEVAAERDKALAEQDVLLQDCIDKLAARTLEAEEQATLSIEGVVKGLDLCITRDEQGQLKTELVDRIAESEASFKFFGTDTTHRMQEVVERVSEFQHILQDHEHALQHQAEELLNRSTKYDLLVCSQRVDKCAVKDKVEQDVLDLDQKVTWITTKMDQLSFSMSFGGDMGSGEPGTAAPRAPPPGSQSADQAEAPATAVATVPEVAGTAGDAGLAVAPASPAVVVAAAAAPPREEQPKEPHSPKTPAVHHFAGAISATGTENWGLVHQQLESMAQALLGLGNAMLRSSMKGVTHEVRLEREAELMHHLECLLHWIMHRMAPASWDPVQLTTLALRSMKAVEDSDFKTSRLNKTWTKKEEPGGQANQDGRHSWVHHRSSSVHQSSLSSPLQSISYSRNSTDLADVSTADEMSRPVSKRRSLRGSARKTSPPIASARSSYRAGSSLEVAGQRPSAPAKPSSAPAGTSEDPSLMDLVAGALVEGSGRPSTRGSTGASRGIEKVPRGSASGTRSRGSVPTPTKSPATPTRGLSPSGSGSHLAETSPVVPPTSARLSTHVQGREDRIATGEEEGVGRGSRVASKLVSGNI